MNKSITGAKLMNKLAIVVFGAALVVGALTYATWSEASSGIGHTPSGQLFTEEEESETVVVAAVRGSKFEWITGQSTGVAMDYDFKNDYGRGGFNIELNHTINIYDNHAVSASIDYDLENDGNIASQPEISRRPGAVTLGVAYKYTWY